MSRRKFKIAGLVLTFFAVLFSLNIALADDLMLDKDINVQFAINQTGFSILNANNYEQRITFYYIPENKNKTKINKRLNKIYIYKGVLPCVEDTNELAALLSLEIAKLMDIKADFFRQFSISYSPRKYEIKSDKKAADLMVKAGYNPVALINYINKTTHEPNWFEYNIMHHKGSERTAYIYQYIYEKYPVYLARNNYLKESEYQNFLRITRRQRKKVRIIQEERIKLQESSANDIH